MIKRQYQSNGIIHVHSVYSDGQRTIPEIAAIANELDIDFMLMSDHNTLQSKLDGFEGWYDDVLVGIGSELNDAEDKNHYLAFNIDQDIDNNVPAEEYVKKVSAQGGFGIIAHPDEDRNHIAAYPPYPWTLWDSDSFDGIEIWNQMSEWMEGLTHLNKYWRAMHPRRSVISPKNQTLAKWDAINQKRKVVGIGGVDAHGHIHKLWGMFPIRIFRYKVSFRTIRTHVLTDEELPRDDYKKALSLLFNAIREANCYVSHRYLGDANDFRITAVNSIGDASMGESLKYKEQTKLYVQNPVSAESRLICNGKQIGLSEGKNLEFNISEPGVYRIETYKEKKAWIFSNHVRIVA